MADRRTSERLLDEDERLLVENHHLDHITPMPLERRTPAGKGRRETEDRTEPMRLSFLALLAERDPAVQTRLNRRITPALELERARSKDPLEDEDRPTDPMVLGAKFSG